MTKQQHPDAPIEAAENEAEPPEAGTPIGKNEWRQAAREIKRDAQAWRWRLRLAEILDQVGDLDAEIKQRQATVKSLTEEQAQLDETVGAARDQAQKTIADAEQKAATILADAQAAQQSASDELAMLQEKRAKKLAELEDADRKLRETRKQMAELRKGLGDEAAA